MNFVVGQKIKTRGRLWEIGEARSFPTGQILRLMPVGTLGNDEIEVISSVESVETIPPQDIQWHIGPPKGWEVFHLGIMLSLHQGSEVMQCLSRGRLEIENYQLIPVLKALARPYQRLLIADDVGLGKTIEAMLIMMELIARRRGNRVLVVVPAGLQDQWYDELLDKLGMEFEIYDSDRIRELRREYARGTNPWLNRNRIITSIDFVKRYDIRRTLRGVKWDLVIVDEAHYLAETVAASRIYRTDRSRFGEFISRSDHCENLLLLTATPHNGYSRGFYSLLRLVDPFLTPNGKRINRDMVDPILVRRVKDEIYEDDGVTKKFKGRSIGSISVPMTDEEKELYSEVCRYTQRQWRRSGKDTAVGFAMTIIKKRLISSLHALRMSLNNRYNSLSDEVIDIKAKRGLIKDYWAGTNLTEEQREKVEKELLTAPLDPGALQTEKREIKRLLDLADGIDISRDSKAQTLLKALKKLFAENPQEKVIIFTEYRDTQNSLFEFLSSNGFDGKIEKMHGGMTRKDRRNAQARFFSPEIQILIGTDSASEGLNLQKRCHIIIHNELPWNPNRLEQRNGRVDRWGQKKDVIIRNLYLEDTIEGEILEILKRKVEKIRKELGSVSEIVGATSDLDMESILLSRGGLKQEDSQASRSIAEAEKEIDRYIELGRSTMEQWHEQTVMKSNRFGKEEQEEVTKRKSLSEGVNPSEDEVKNLVETVVKQYGGAINEMEESIFRIDVPQALRRGEFTSPVIERATFKQSLASELDAKTVDYISPVHPLVQSITSRLRSCLYDPEGVMSNARISYRIMNGAPATGILFTFLGSLHYSGRSGSGKLCQEMLVPVFIDLNGTTSLNMERDWELFQSEGIYADFPPNYFEENFEPLFDLLREAASEEAISRLGKELTGKQRGVTEISAKLKDDVFEWKEERKRYIERELSGPPEQLEIIFDEGERIRLEEAEKRRRRKLGEELLLLDKTAQNRIEEIEAESTLRTSDSVELVGALCIIPDYEVMGDRRYYGKVEQS